MTLVFFGYTHCPDICNVVLANIASALRGSPEDVRDSTRMIFVTTDPARDTAEVVREYLDRFDPRFEGLIGDRSAPWPRAAEGLHISYERRDGSTGGHDGSGHTGDYEVGPRRPTRRRSSTARRTGRLVRTSPPSPTCAPTSPGSRD